MEGCTIRYTRHVKMAGVAREIFPRAISQIQIRHFSYTSYSARIWNKSAKKAPPITLHPVVCHPTMCKMVRKFIVLRTHRLRIEDWKRGLKFERVNGEVFEKISRGEGNWKFRIESSRSSLYKTPWIHEISIEMEESTSGYARYFVCERFDREKFDK